MASISRIFGSNQGSDYDALVETECSECFIRVSGFTADIDGVATVFISGFTSHNNPDQLSWKWRFHRIRKIIKGELDPDYEILSPEVLDNLIKALQESRDKIFNKEPIQNS
jgi:hypothetical protein